MSNAKCPCEGSTKTTFPPVVSNKNYRTFPVPVNPPSEKSLTRVNRFRRSNSPVRNPPKRSVSPVKFPYPK